jgi:modulator of FtsH protease HflC
MALQIQPRHILIGSVALVLFFAMSAFTVRETEVAMKLTFGEIVKSDYKPGLHFKIPLVNQVLKFEKRIISPRNFPSESFLTSEGKILLIDFYIKWRIEDVVRYYQATGGGNSDKAAERLGSIVKDGIKGVIARRTIQQVVSAERAQFTGEILKLANDSARRLGVRLIDVRVKKIDLPVTVSESVFSRMRQDFERQAKKLRAEGEGNAQELRANAERERTEIIAEAYKQAEIIRGEGDARSAEIYAQAYSQDPEFYSFHRSQQAYRKAIGTEGDLLVISPQSDFFKYLKRSTR